jgi:hypothetical protein
MKLLYDAVKFQEDSTFLVQHGYWDFRSAIKNVMDVAN